MGSAQEMKQESSTGKDLFRLFFDVIVILFALVALLPTKKLVAVETGCLGDQIQTAQDETSPAAFTCPAAGPQVPRGFVYFIPAGSTHLLESSFVSGRPLRGPPLCPGS